MDNTEWLLHTRHHAVFSILLCWLVTIQRIDCDTLCYSLEIKQTPSIGEDMSITANVSEVTQGVGRRWTVRDLNAEPHHEVDLIFDGICFNSIYEKKFTEVNVSDAYILIIHNLTDADVNKIYTLYYAFDTCVLNFTFGQDVHGLTNNDKSAEVSRPPEVSTIAGVLAIWAVSGILVLVVVICRRKHHQRRMVNQEEDPSNMNLVVLEQILETEA